MSLAPGHERSPETELNDGEQELLSESRKRIVRVASWTFEIVAFAAYLNSFREQPQVVFATLCWIVGRFVSTFVHECGHAGAALSCNWRVLTFVVRPFGIQVPNQNFAIFSSKIGRINLGGWIATVPRNLASGTKANWSLILVAGAGVNFLFALVAFAGWATFLKDFDTPNIIVSRIGLGFGLQSLHSCVFSILPNGFSDTPSDGTKWRALRRSDSTYGTDKPLVWLGTLLTNKVRLRDRPDWLIDAVQAMPDASGEKKMLMEGLQISVTMDGKQVDMCRARELIDQYREKHGASQWLNACDAYLSAVWEADAQRATATMSLPPGSEEMTPMFLAAEAAVAARMGQATLVRAKLKEMKKALRMESPFNDLTFRDIRTQVESVLAYQLQHSPPSPERT